MSPVKVRLSLNLDEFGLETLPGRAKQLGLTVEQFVTTALRYYLDERDGERAAARVPAFRQRAEPPGADALQLSPALEDDAWRSLRRDAEEQGVSLSVLAEHAALLLVADIDRGRVALRTLQLAGPA